jgi:LPXTG-motif cell wall-anchored protein
MFSGMIPGVNLGEIKAGAAGRLVNDGKTGTVTFGTLSNLSVLTTTTESNAIISASDNLSTGFDVYGKNATSTKLMLRNMTGAGSYSGASGAFVQLIGTTSGTVDYMEFHANSGVFDLDSLKLTSADNSYTSYDFTVQPLDSSFSPKGEPVSLAGVNKQNFSLLDVSARESFDGIYGFRITVNQGCQICVDDISVTNPRIPAIAKYTAIASETTQTPIAGANNEVTLTVKDSVGNTDNTFNGLANVTVSGYTVAPNNSYGSFNGSNLTESAQKIPVDFNNGVARANLTLNNALLQDISFNIEGVNTPTTNSISITPVPAEAKTMALIRDITAPTVNGGQLIQQPQIVLKDAYENICTNDSLTTIIASKNDEGLWALTGDVSVKVTNGVASFSNLGASSKKAISKAKLAFNAIGCSQITSGEVSIPEPENTIPTFIGDTTTLDVDENADAVDITNLLHVKDMDSDQTLTWSEKEAPNHGGVLSFSNASSISGSLDIAPTGKITYTPAHGYSGTEAFTVEVNDGHGAVAKTITVNVENKKPTVNNVNIIGIKNVGKILSGDYTYLDPENDEEGNTTYKWYRADNDQGLNKTEIAEETSKEYTVRAEDEEKYISFEVTPAAKVGTIKGDSKLSPWVKINDVTPPVWANGFPSDGTVTKDSIELKVQINETGNGYFVCLPKGSNELTPTQVKLGQDADGNTVNANKKGVVALIANSQSEINITSLDVGTTYDVYLVAEDKLSNLQTSVVKISRTTSVEPIANFSKVSQTAKTVSFSWSPALWATGIRIEQSPTNSENWTISETGSIKTDATTAKVTGLSEDAEYKFRLVVTGGANAGTSNVITGKTLQLPSVVSVSLPSNATYGKGQEIYFTVNYSEVVNVNGTPKIEIKVGDSIKHASYLSGSGTKNIVFRYIVEDNDFDNNGIEMSNVILIDGGAITNSYSEDAKLNLNGMESTAAIKVDAKGPKIESVVAPSSGIYKIGDKLEFTVNFDENVVLSGDLNLNLIIGDKPVKAQYVSGAGTASIHFKYIILMGDADNDGIELNPEILLNGGSIKDGFGNDAVVSFSAVDTSTIFVDTAAPVLENASISLDKKEITLTFNENILDATGNSLKYGINFSSNSGVNYSPLGNDSTILINGKELKIRFSSALKGSKNRIKVAKKYLMDAIGNIGTQDVETDDLGSSIKVVEDMPLTEENLDGRLLSLTIDGDTFKDAVLDKNNFVLNNAPNGASIESVNYIDSTHFSVKLRFDGTDLDRSITNLSVTVDSSELTKNEVIESNELAITVKNDVESISIKNNESIKEGQEDKKIITVTITGGQFVSNLTQNNWMVTNLPSGVTKGKVTRISSNTVEIMLNGNSVKDYDSDINNVSVTCTAGEYVDSDGGSSLSTSTGVIFTAKTVGTVVTSNLVTNVKYSTATVSGKVMSTGNGTITERGFVYSTNNNPEVGVTGVKKVVEGGVDVGDFKVNLTDLNPNTAYYVRAFVKNEEGISYGEEVNFKTNILPKPTNTFGSVVNKDGKSIGNININVISEVNETYTINLRCQEAIKVKQSDGTMVGIKDYSKLGFTTDSISSISITADGEIIANNLEKGKRYEYEITYDLNGEKVIVGTMTVVVSDNGEISLVTTLIDPYGVIRDSVSRKVIDGVSVKLYYADTSRNKAAGKIPDTEVNLPIIDEFKPNNNKNPQISDAYGAYAFMVYPNTDYYIVASKDGYDKYVSSTINVENVIVERDFEMKLSNVSKPDENDKTNDIVNTDGKDETIIKDTTLPKTGSSINMNIFIFCGIVSTLLVFATKRKRKIS